jgi:hypothetical protein
MMDDDAKAWYMMARARITQDMMAAVTHSSSRRPGVTAGS